MVFPTKLRRYGGGGASSSSSAKNNFAEPVASSSKPQRPRPIVTTGKLVNLSVEQTKDLNFPIGCPVWYNFTQEVDGARMDIREGVVDSINLDIFSKTLVYKVARKKSQDGSGSSSLDIVFDNDIAYAVNCPVVISSGGNDSTTKADGEILFAKPIQGENGCEMTYIVRCIGESNHYVSIEEGVKVGRLKYRAPKKLPPKQPENDAKQVMQNSSKNVIPPSSSTNVSEEECSVSKDSDPSETSSGQDRLSSVSSEHVAKKKRSRQEDPTLHGLAKKKATVGGKHSREGMQSNPRHLKRRDSSSSYRKHSSMKYPTNGGRHHTAGNASRDQLHRTKEVKMKVETTETQSESKPSWELPHTWHENDGAI